MRRACAIALLLILSVMITSCDYSNEEYEEAYEKGYASGYESGYEDGCYEMESEYELGYDDGYYAGALYACMFFGDVDKAFKCAINGCAWDTFVSSYDKFIEDIFDNEDEESEIFWALISLMVSEDPTESDIELLTSKFGKDLFERNGVSLSY